MAKRVLVLGGCGFIGKVLCEALRSDGQIVTTLGRPVARTSNNTSNQVTRATRSPEHIQPYLRQCDAVVLLASASTPFSSAGKPLEELEANLQPTLALLEAMQGTPHIPLLFISSAGAIYSANGKAASTESDLPDPLSYHGAGKVAAEQFIAAYCRQFGGAATIIRPSNVYGPGQTERAGFGIVPHAFGAMRRAETLTVWGDGSAARDYLYIDDLVSLCLLALRSKSNPGVLTLNASSGFPVTLRELFILLESTARLRLHLRYDNVRSTDASRIAIDSQKARRHLNWEPLIGLPEGLKRTWAWIQSQPA